MCDHLQAGSEALWVSVTGFTIGAYGPHPICKNEQIPINIHYIICEALVDNVDDKIYT